MWDVDNIISKIFGGRVRAYIVREFEALSLTAETCDQTGKNILRVLGNVVAKWHHQLRVGCMISHVRSTIMWRNISEQTTRTQESRGKAVSYRLATLLFGKGLKKPFLTQMLKRLIDLMRTGLFCKRNFHRQLVYMEEMELHVFFDRDLRQFEPKNSYCISNMNFHSLVLNLRRFLFLGKIQRFEWINNYIILHFCQVKSAMRTNLTSRLSQRFMVAPATRTGSRQASESLFSSNN